MFVIRYVSVVRCDRRKGKKKWKKAFFPFGLLFEKKAKSNRLECPIS